VAQEIGDAAKKTMEPILFDIIGPIEQVEGRRLSAQFGQGRWRKVKGIATVRLISTGEILRAAVHWYEAHGIGRRKLKIKRVLKAGEGP